MNTVQFLWIIIYCRMLNDRTFLITSAICRMHCWDARNVLSDWVAFTISVIYSLVVPRQAIHAWVFLLCSTSHHASILPTSLFFRRHKYLHLITEYFISCAIFKINLILLLDRIIKLLILYYSFFDLFGLFGLTWLDLSVIGSIQCNDHN